MRFVHFSAAVVNVTHAHLYALSFTIGLVNARYVKIQLRDNDCLQLGTVEVWGY